MNDPMLRALLARITALEETRERPRRGEVVTASPLTIALGGGSVAVSANHIASYTPTIGDQVHVGVWGNDLIVYGEIV